MQVFTDITLYTFRGDSRLALSEYTFFVDLGFDYSCPGYVNATSTCCPLCKVYGACAQTGLTCGYTAKDSSAIAIAALNPTTVATTTSGDLLACFADTTACEALALQEVKCVDAANPACLCLLSTCGAVDLCTGVTCPSPVQCGNFTCSNATGTCSIANPGSCDNCTTAPACTCNSDGTCGCFLGTETVQMEGGVIKFIQDVVVGDRILSANSKHELVFSEVIFIPHPKNDIPATFVVIEAENGISLVLTPAHDLPNGMCGAVKDNRPSSEVKVGSCIVSTSGEVKVLSTRLMTARGVYTVLTLEEFIVVSNVIASPQGIYHAASDKAFAYIRAAYAMFPSLFKSQYFVKAYQYSIEALVGKKWFVDTVLGLFMSA